MKRIRASILLALGLATPLGLGQKARNNPPQKPLKATVCEILDDPSAYNNRLVKVGGYVSASSEYSLLLDERCDTNPIWLAFADGSAAPQLVATANGTGTAGGRDSKGRQIPPIPVHLIRDANYTELMQYLAISAKGEACADSEVCLETTIVGWVLRLSPVLTGHVRTGIDSPVCNYQVSPPLLGGHAAKARRTNTTWPI